MTIHAAIENRTTRKHMDRAEARFADRPHEGENMSATYFDERTDRGAREFERFVDVT